MISVRNTKELEQMYSLNEIPDDELIIVTGGLEGKFKYQNEKYQNRTTYIAGQLKNIIQQMKEIERDIPQDWSEWQKAKYIYTVLAENIGYNYDKSTYGNQQSSNLAILLSKKGICAGYSLLFKEMMDRQGIKCDYIRGTYKGREKHAWNVLSIDGIHIPVDLTWDSGEVNKGKGLQYFGNDELFLEEHIQDYDEKKYEFSMFTKEGIEAIDISQTMNKELSKEEKMNVLQLAVEQTYKKYVKINSGMGQVKTAIVQYINGGNAQYFTNEMKSRDNIKKYLSQEDMLDLIIKQYVTESAVIDNNETDFLRMSINENLKKYNEKQAGFALKKYILEGNSSRIYKTK